MAASLLGNAIALGGVAVHGDDTWAMWFF